MPPNPVPAGLSAWLECLAWILGAILLAMQITKNLRGPDPAPPNPQLEQANNELERRVNVLEKAFGEAATEQKDGRARMYQKIESVRIELKDDLSALHHTVNTSGQETERSLGRIEGMLKARSVS